MTAKPNKNVKITAPMSTAPINASPKTNNEIACTIGFPDVLNE